MAFILSEDIIDFVFEESDWLFTDVFDIIFDVIFGIVVLTVIFSLIGTVVSAAKRGNKASGSRNRTQRTRTGSASRQYARAQGTAANHGNTTHEDHTAKIPHDESRTYRKNHEKDVVKDPPLSQAERNVLYGK